MKNLKISEAVSKKLQDKHGVTRAEIEQCFLNRCGAMLIDTREKHRTDPATRWFLAKTNRGRVLKIVYIPLDGGLVLRTAYDANPVERGIYARHGGVTY